MFLYFICTLGNILYVICQKVAISSQMYPLKHIFGNLSRFFQCQASIAATWKTSIPRPSSISEIVLNEKFALPDRILLIYCGLTPSFSAMSLRENWFPFSLHIVHDGIGYTTGTLQPRCIITPPLRIINKSGAFT